MTVVRRVGIDRQGLVAHLRAEAKVALRRADPWHVVLPCRQTARPLISSNLRTISTGGHCPRARLTKENLMRCVLFLAGAVCVLAIAALLVVTPSFLPAQQGNGGDTPLLKPPQTKLPIAQVVLFSSGVGYYQREGEVEGDARIDLSFPVENINDLLKSMVLQDLGGGQISAVSYDSHDPIERTLRSFAMNLTDNPGFADVLNQARGEKVEVTMQASTTQPGTLTGVIIGIEKQKQPAGKDGVVEIEMLNLLSAEGMRCLKLSEVQRVRFLNPMIDSELRRALEVLAMSQ